MIRATNPNFEPLSQPEPAHNFYARISAYSIAGTPLERSFVTEEMVAGVASHVPANVQSLAVLGHGDMDKQTSLVLDIDLHDAGEGLGHVRKTIASLAVEAAAKTDHGLAQMQILTATLVSHEQFAQDRLEIPTIETFDRGAYTDRKLAIAFDLQKIQVLQQTAELELLPTAA